MTIETLEDLDRLIEMSGLYLCGAFTALRDLGRRSPELAAAAIEEARVLYDAATSEPPQPTAHWSLERHHGKHGIRG